MPKLFLIALLIAPSLAYAYLDPGSGAVLVNLLIAGAAALLYSLRGIILRLMGKGPMPRAKEQDLKLALFSEGRQYWHSFRPIINALIERQIPFAYHTLDVEDPALMVDSELMQARFLGFGAMGRYRAGRIPQPIVLSTTPNIGCPGYPVQRSPHTRRLIHFFHSVADLSMYRKGSLDHYDEVILTGDFQTKSIRALETLRGLKTKKLISLGLPYLDDFLQEASGSELKTEAGHILAASSWGDKGLLKHYGVGPLIDLAQKGYRVTIRPHPQSFVTEAGLMQKLQKSTLAEPNITWDLELSPVQSMQKAQLLISDSSSIRFDFAFIYKKPVMSLTIPEAAMPGFERDDLGENWADGAAHQIGKVLTETDVKKGLQLHITEILEHFDPSRIRAFRKRTVTNFGEAGEAIAGYLQESVSRR